MPKKASNKTASFMQFLHETYEQYKQKIKDGSHIPVKPHVFEKQDKTSLFGFIILHANNSCLNCTRASWKVKTILSKEKKWVELHSSFIKKVNPLFIFGILKLRTVNETRLFALVILDNDKNSFFWVSFWWNSRFLSENISPNPELRIVTCW